MTPCIMPDPAKVDISNAGYTSLKGTGRRMSMHVLSYLWNVGDIPDGMVVDHICMNRGCMEPSHLQIRNRGENAALDNRRRGVCRNGHPDSDRYPPSKGHKRGRCRMCSRGANQRHWAKSKGAQ